MYWFVQGSPASILPLLGACLLWAVGGWQIASHAFRLPPTERVAVGVGTGLALHLTLANLLGHGLGPAPAFAVAALIVFSLGLLLAVRHPRRWEWRDARRSWAQFLALALLAVVLALIGRGLGILDDRKNLALISLMANGHIPPPFYMDAATPFKYHYGSQLFGAELASLGGLTPWSAFDAGKAMLGGLAILLAWHVGRRVTHREAGGYAMAGLVAFASGARWVLLLLPPSWIGRASETIQLWGSGADTAPDLSRALLATWTVSGGPPVGIPFAFVNGMGEPLVLSMQAGALPLARALLFLLLLTLRRDRSAWAIVPWTSMLALLALTWETDFLVFGGVLVGLTLAFCVWRRGAMLQRSMKRAAMSVLAACGLALVQGGTLTETARGLLGLADQAGVHAAGLGLRWPPAIISAQLGALDPGRPAELMVALAEAGPALLVVPLGFLFLRRSAMRRFEWASLALGAPLAALLPCFVSYAVDRDITRFTGYAMAAWFLLGVSGTWILARRLRGWPVAPLGLAWGAISILGGVVVFGSLLTAAGRSMFSESIAPVDASLTRQVWGRLEADALVLDSHPYRAVIVTGLRTRSTGTDFRPLPDWAALIAEPIPAAILHAGFRYAYVDSLWWESMSEKQRAAFQTGCAVLVASAHDRQQNGDRWLYDLMACRSG